METSSEALRFNFRARSDRAARWGNQSDYRFIGDYYPGDQGRLEPPFLFWVVSQFDLPNFSALPTASVNFRRRCLTDPTKAGLRTTPDC